MKTECVDSFGQWIKLRRKVLDKTQEKLAYETGCSPAMIKKIESGERRPSRQVARLLAEKLEIGSAKTDRFIEVARGNLSVTSLPMPDQILHKAASETPSPPAYQKRLFNSIPIPATLLVGREYELNQVVRLLQDPACRLLTLTGPGGVGKTHLAIEAALRLQTIIQTEFAFIALIGVNSPNFLFSAIADGVHLAASGPMDIQSQLCKYFETRQAIIVLDNMEHLLDGAENIGRLLQQAPGIKFMVTSREQLHLLAEWVMEIQGLPIPQNDEPQTLTNNSSVKLFLQRAQRANLAFQPTSEDLRSIVRICQLLQGLPLGIELAAAWIKTLTCQEIASEIENGLSFLESNTRDLPERHRSLTAVFNHSWDLLTDQEQSVLKKLSVFLGGFSRAAAEQVAEATLAILSSLVDKSLIRRTTHGRYEFHQLIHQFARRQLTQDAQLFQEIQTRHSHYFLSLVQELEDTLRSPNQREALEELRADLDDIRKAWNTAIQTVDIVLLLDSAGALFYLYELHQYFQEAILLYQNAANAVLAEIDRISVAANPPYQSNLMITWAILTSYQGFFNLRPGNNQEASRLFSQSIPWLRALDHPNGLAFALLHYGVIHWGFGAYDIALHNMQEALEIAITNQIPWITSTAYGFIGAVHYDLGNYPDSFQALSSSMKICQEIGDPQLCLFMGIYFSRSCEALGRPFEGQAQLERWTAYTKEIGNLWIAGIGIERLGMIEQKRGNWDTARQCYEESVQMLRNVGDKWSLAWSLLALGRHALLQDDLQKAENSAREVLLLTFPVAYFAMAIDALAILANVEARRGNQAQALTIIIDIIHHPAIKQETKTGLKQLQSQLLGDVSSATSDETGAPLQPELFHKFIENLIANFSANGIA